MIRPYRPGDDVRHIDWNVTARLREPHVRVHVGERAMTAWLLLDVSASMTFGTADRRKADVAEGVALAIGHVATRRGNRLGVVAIGGGEPRIMRPRQGRLGLLALLAELRTEPEADGAGVDRARRRDAADGGAGAQPRARRGRLGLPRRPRLGGAAARPARAPRRARGRDPRPARARAAGGRRPLVHRSRDRAPAERQHEPPRRAQALRQGGRRRARGGRRRRCGAPAPSTSCSRRRATGCARWRGTCGARRCGCAARAGAGPHELPRARRPDRPAPAAARRGRLRGHAAPPPPRRRALRQPRAAARPRHRAPGLAPAPAAAAAAARPRRARRRARAPAAHASRRRSARPRW